MKVAASTPVSGRTGIADMTAVFARWLLGALFIFIGLTKSDPVAFLKLVREYDVFYHHLLLNLATSTLPWFEVCCGLLLLLGVAVRGAIVMLLVMLLSFSVVVLLRALAIREMGGLWFCDIKFDCGCGAGEKLVCAKLGENLFLISVSTALLVRRNHRLCLRCSIFKSAPIAGSS
jgi:uncharacterized membrane protein YphA (DoxX/SURF4 family)